MRIAAFLLLSIAAFAQPDAPSTTKFLALTAAHAAIVTIDWHQSVVKGYGEEVGSSWLYGKYPQDHFAKNTTLMFGEVAVGAVVGRYLQTRHGAIRHFWWVPQTALTISHTVGVIHNERRGQGIW